MYVMKREIYLGDTDASGVLYFPRQLVFAVELFESFLGSRGYGVGKMLTEGPYLFPVIQANSFYRAPLRVGDSIEAGLRVSQIGESSVTFSTTFLKGIEVVGGSEITHVLILKKTFEKTPLPQEYRSLFGELQVDGDRKERESCKTVV